MAHLMHQRLDHLYSYTDHDLDCEVTALPPGRVLVKAYFVVKRSARDPDSAAVLLKTITPVAVPGVGHISANGTVLPARLQFQLTPADLSPAVLVPGREYEWNIKLVLDSGRVLPWVTESKLRVKASVAHATM